MVEKSSKHALIRTHANNAANPSSEMIDQQLPLSSPLTRDFSQIRFYITLTGPSLIQYTVRHGRHQEKGSKLNSPSMVFHTKDYNFLDWLTIVP